MLNHVLASYVFVLPGALAYAYLGYAGRAALTASEGGIRNFATASSLSL